MRNTERIKSESHVAQAQTYAKHRFRTKVF